MPAYPGFIGDSGKLASVVADCSRSVNFYLEKRTQSGRPALYSWPGQTQFGVVTVDVGGRALAEMNDRCLAVVGAGVHGIASDGTATRFGAVLTDGSRAQIRFNGITGGQALISSGANAYALTLSTNVLSAAVLVGAAHQIGFLDGYGIAFDRTLARFRLSNLNDFTTWDPTQFQGRSDAPDNWLAMCVNAPDVWLIGGQTGCVWYDAGSYPMPLQPRPGANFRFGIAAADSLAAVGDSVLWVSRNSDGQGIVVRARGYVPQPFSSPALETAIQKYARTSRIDDAEGTGIQWEGHNFYVLNFPSVPATWFTDLDTGQWDELGSWNAARGDYDAWRARVHCLAFGKHLVAQSGSNIIAFLDITSATEVDGTTMRPLRIPQSLIARDGQRMFVDNFRLLMQVGVGTQTGQGQNPLAMLRQSKDFGQTWGNERRAAIGAAGKFATQVVFPRCGSSEVGWVPEVVISDPVPVRIVGADIEGDNLNLGGPQ